jgi:hypothetical protein
MSTNTFPPGDPVPAIPEAAASGRVAAIFAELREATGMPIVNLVWRHLATEPGALEWTWAALGPLYRSGAVLGEAMHLHERMVLPAVAPWPRAALRAAGIDAGAEATIAAVLASYDRGNRQPARLHGPAGASGRAAWGFVSAYLRPAVARPGAAAPGRPRAGRSVRRRPGVAAQPPGAAGAGADPGQPLPPPRPLAGLPGAGLDPAGAARPPGRTGGRGGGDARGRGGRAARCCPIPAVPAGRPAFARGPSNSSSATASRG